MKAIGSATTGSSEAILLGGLAMKKRWQAARKAAGKSIHEPGPNIVLGAEAHCSLEKFTRYFDVEARLVPVTEESGYVMDPHEALKHVDENTIGICQFPSLGPTLTSRCADYASLRLALQTSLCVSNTGAEARRCPAHPSVAHVTDGLDLHRPL